MPGSCGRKPGLRVALHAGVGSDVSLPSARRSLEWDGGLSWYMSDGSAGKAVVVCPFGVILAAGIPHSKYILSTLARPQDLHSLVIYKTNIGPEICKQPRRHCDTTAPSTPRNRQCLAHLPAPPPTGRTTSSRSTCKPPSLAPPARPLATAHPAPAAVAAANGAGSPRVVSLRLRSRRPLPTRRASERLSMVKRSRPRL